jgi:hypothetical protein
MGRRSLALARQGKLLLMAWYCSTLKIERDSGRATRSRWVDPATCLDEAAKLRARGKAYRLAFGPIDYAQGWSWDELNAECGQPGT